jgi:RNA polymerase sigma-70 factor (ECF subfamily)
VRRNRDLEKKIEDYVIEYKEVFYRLAYSYVKNADDALDIVQESIYKGISSMSTIKDPSSIKTWFYRIIVNTSLDFIRKRKREIAVDEEFLFNNSLGEVDNYPDIDLEKALGELPEIYHSIIVLRYFEDLKIKEIAEILDMNVNTVKTRLYKGLEELKLKMDVEDEEA